MDQNEKANQPTASNQTAASNQPAASNPLADSLNITLSVPHTIRIKMVDATALSDYELWFFISSILASAFFGFFVAFLQSLKDAAGPDKVLGWISLVWFILGGVSIWATLYKRKLVTQASKEISLKLSQ